MTLQAERHQGETRDDRLADLQTENRRAHERLERERKQERRQAARFAAGIFAALALGACAVAGAGVFLDLRPNASPAATILVVAGALLLLGATIAPIVTIALQRARSRHNELSQREFESIDFAAISIEDTALAGLVKFNFRLMDRFVAVALGQAKAAYLFCAAAATAALLVLVGGVTALIAIPSITGQVAVGLVTAAGVALSGFISTTFMQVFKMTSRQMSYYYGQPLVHCYLLHAEWLAQRSEHTDPESAKQMQSRLVRATLGASREAQQQLLDLMEIPAAERRTFNGADVP